MDRTTQKHIFGFDKGYIWVVKHSISKLEDERNNIKEELSQITPNERK